jgi:hypothetical protein
VDAVSYLKATLLPERDEDAVPRFALEGEHHGFVDRWMPRRAGPFVLAAFAIPLAVWGLAFALAADRGRFLSSRDWIAQPFYFAVHLIVARQFVTTYARHFTGGLRHLGPAAAGEALPAMRRLLGWRGFVWALAAAAPLVWFDLVYLTGREFLEGPDAQGKVGAVAVSDHLLGILWSVEWVVNAYVWVLLVGFAGLTIRTTDRHPFAAPVEVVLHERHYRPFLLMSAQGASIIVGFTLATGVYVLVTKGETTDWIGLWATAGLLLLSFVPPWVRLKGHIAKSVRKRTDRLTEEVFAARKKLERVDDTVPPVTNEELGARLDVVLTVLHLDQLDRLYRDLGKSEGNAVLLRLLAPLSTVLAKLLRP